MSGKTHSPNLGRLIILHKIIHSVKFRIIATFVIALLVVVGITAFVSFQLVRWYVHEKIDDDGVSTAQTCAILFESFSDNGVNLEDPEEYAQCRTILHNLCKQTDMSYLYAYRCDPENNTITYLMCVAADDADDAEVARERAYGTTLDATITDVEKQALEGDAPKKAIEYNNEFGHVLDWVCLVDAWDGNILAGASYSVDGQRTRVFQNMIAMLVPVIAVLFVVLVIQLIIMSRYVFNPIRMISNRMRKFKADDASALEPIDVPLTDELSAIAEAFDDMVGEIAEYTSNIEKLTEERVQASVELDVARRIQLGMVPEQTEVDGSGFEVVACSRAAREVGGDFYDVAKLEDGRVATIVGDVSGKGVAAALFMAMTKAVIRDGLLEGESPADVLNHANTRLCESNPEGMFVTVFACVLDPATGEVRYANAGHTPPFVVGGDVRTLDADPGVLLGLFDDSDLQEASFRLERGESLLIFTDGATEAVSATREFLGEQALRERIAADVPYEKPARLVDVTCRIVDKHAEGCEQFDDLTLVALMRLGEEGPSDASLPPEASSPADTALPSNTFTDTALPGNAIEVSPDISTLGTIREAILATQADDLLKRRTCLACEEAFVNVVSYSGAEKAWYAIEIDGEELRITIADNGAPFDPTAAVPAEKEFEDLDSGGMGIGLVRELASDVSYRRADGRNVLVISMKP